MEVENYEEEKTCYHQGVEEGGGARAKAQTPIIGIIYIYIYIYSNQPPPYNHHHHLLPLLLPPTYQDVDDFVKAHDIVLECGASCADHTLYIHMPSNFFDNGGGL